MLDQLQKYCAKLLSDRAALPGMIAMAAMDDTIVNFGNSELSKIAETISEKSGCACTVVARPSLPFFEWIVRRMSADSVIIVPGDTETRTFLHDIPVLRKQVSRTALFEAAVELLGKRKGIVAEGIGIIATGALTVEQAYINWSSIFHSTFVKYLEDVLAYGFTCLEEQRDFEIFRNQWLQPLSMQGLSFRKGPLTQRSEILDEMDCVGRYTVGCGLVDSFFGNISCSDGRLIYISQTAASLDELAGQIDPVPFDGSSTAGITASSELAAHKGIYETFGCNTILHGHPRFSVIMSMQCEHRSICGISDCWRECGRTRYLGDTPVVAGEVGAGGLATKLRPVIGETGNAIVYGHGVFSIGYSGFEEAFSGIIKVEQFCRNEYFRRLDAAVHP